MNKRWGVAKTLWGTVLYVYVLKMVTAHVVVVMTVRMFGKGGVEKPITCEHNGKQLFFAYLISMSVRTQAKCMPP